MPQTLRKSSDYIYQVHDLSDSFNDTQHIINQYMLLRESAHIQKLLSNNGEFHVATEHRSIHDIQTLIGLGHQHFSEKYCQEMLFKWSAPNLAQANCYLNFFGHIQSNKIRKIIGISHSIESVSNLETAKRFARLENETGLNRRYLLQVNINREHQKNGCMPESASNLIDQIHDETNLRIAGIMIIPKIDENPISAFKWARNFADKHRLEHCAMGMSNDYQITIDSGATIVRVGRLIWTHNTHATLPRKTIINA